MFERRQILRILLLSCGLYYFIAAFAHFFGLTLFPFYDGALYSPYHDFLLGLCDIVFVMIFLVVARDPVKNEDTLNVIIIGFVLVILGNLGIIWKIDFTALGSSYKFSETIVETILALGALGGILFLRPTSKNNGKHDRKF